MLRRAIFLLLACALVARPQDPPPPPAGPAAREVLAKALQGPAAERLLAVRWFEDEGGGVVRVEGERQDGGLRLSVTFLPVGAMREERTRVSCEVGPDGAVRVVESESVRGRERFAARGEVREGKLHLVAEEGETSTAEWGEEVLPLPLLAFALPALCDQGLPARLRVRVFHGFSREPEEKLATLTWSEQDGAWKVEVTALAEGQPGTRVVSEAGTGAPREVVLSGMRLTPIDAQEAARRLTPAKPAETPAKPAETPAKPR